MYKRVLEFWFSDLTPQDWYKKDSSIDNSIRDQFSDTLNKAARGELFLWRKSVQGRLAEIIVLDQFSRNIYRGSPSSFKYDSLALILAQEANRLPESETLPKEQLAFLYMPFMHSESLAIHTEAVKLFSKPGLEESLKFEIKHKDIIEEFGRYPHRNLILGRVSTDKELAFLSKPGSSF